MRGNEDVRSAVTTSSEGRLTSHIIWTSPEWLVVKKEEKREERRGVPFSNTLLRLSSFISHQ